MSKGEVAYVKYSSNNSGGAWWLTRKDWDALEGAGWEVEWEDFLGAPAHRATRRGLSLAEAVDEFERVTGQFASEQGCPCCGPPHEFASYDKDDGWIGAAGGGGWL